MLHEERSAEQTLVGLAHQLLELDYENPMAFERAASICAEAERAATSAVEARGEHEFKTHVTTGLITRTEIQAAIKRSIAS